MTSVARMLIGVGLVIAATGGVLLLANALGLGHLPGDFRWQRGRVGIIFPLASSLLVSVALTILLNLVLRLFVRR